MSQHDFNVANQGFPAFRADMNNAFGALATNSAGTTEPTTTYAYQYWYDETTNLLKMRNGADDAWITLAFFDQTNDEWEVRTAVIQAVDSAGVVIKTDDGTTRVTVADNGSVTINTSLDVDNIKIDGNSITSTDTNGDINITPNGSGKVVLDGLSYPTADGTDGQVLTTDGAGNIAFEDAGGAGKVLQVVSATKTDTLSTSSTSFIDVSGLSVSITPSSASSKIFITYSVNVGFDANRGQQWRLMRDSTAICIGDAGGGRTRSSSFTFRDTDWSFINRATWCLSNNFLDSPNTTSATTYKLQIGAIGETDGTNVYVNRTSLDQDSIATGRTASTITVMEIAG